MMNNPRYVIILKIFYKFHSFCKFSKNYNIKVLIAIVFKKKSIFCHKFGTRIWNCTVKWESMDKKNILGETRRHPFYALSKHFSARHFVNPKFKYCES